MHARSDKLYLMERQRLCSWRHEQNTKMATSWLVFEYEYGGQLGRSVRHIATMPGEYFVPKRLGIFLAKGKEHGDRRGRWRGERHWGEFAADEFHKVWRTIEPGTPPSHQAWVTHKLLDHVLKHATDKNKLGDMMRRCVFSHGSRRCCRYRE